MARALALLPVGPVDRRTLDDLARDLEARGLRVRLLPQAALPRRAFDPRRRQYRAEPFLALAASQAGERVLALTEVDLYSGRLNFVFGVAESPGRAAVVSLHRLGAGGDPARSRERTLKEAVHELGHTLGLAHCPDPGCIMHFSNALADTDRKASALCGACRRALGEPGLFAVGSGSE